MLNSTNSTVIAEALSEYISAVTNSNTSNSNSTLSLDAIDKYLERISDVDIAINTTVSFLVAQRPNQGNTIVLGASFNHGTGGELINNGNKESITNTPVSAAAIVRREDLTRVTSLNMLIIDQPTAFRNIDNSTNRTLASSIIIVSVNRISPAPINISLYFQVWNESRPNISDPVYFCSFYDSNSSQWNDSGCTPPQYNASLNRFECSCNHSTSFALLWLPNVPLTRYLDAQDIASLVFQSISIVCFICIIIHAIVTRLRDPLMSLRAFDLLPLISCASTTILFIFYIALGMTVYTKTSSDDEKEKKCFLSSKVLMFFVYFFVLFMFCTKTSVGYYNYLRFVHLFPQPPLRQLWILLIISFFISITWVASAAGFDSNPSFNITELLPYKICWFNRNVIYYFFTIPVCIFLLINLILFMLVARRIINHVQNATSPHQSFERMKRCVIVLLSSCVTQGIGWLLGPLITVINSDQANVLGWFFIIFNGLEGLWAIILYAIIRSQRIDEQKRLVASKDLAKSTSLSSTKRTKNRKNDTNRSLTRRFQTANKNSGKEWNAFNDLYSTEGDDRTSSTC